jgi:phosphoglycerate-specific signal transduction histidine kinase
MGVLTEHLTQLRNEILALRSARQGLAQALERETEERRADVSQTLANFSKSFAARARRTKADRLGSLSDLKRTVNGLRTEVHTDLSSIRQAWSALCTPSRGAVEKLASQTMQETKADMEGSQGETGGQPPLAVGSGEKPARKKRKH